jgi:hypothetical protein
MYTNDNRYDVYLGAGWSVNIEIDYNPPGNFIQEYCLVDILDEKKAIIFALKWT